MRSVEMLRCCGVAVLVCGVQCLADNQPTTNSFEVVALVDSLDFAKDYDIETATE